MPILKLAAVAIGVALASSAQAATQFKATINAAQIVGGSTSTGTGTATATLTGGPGTWSFQYVATFEGYDFGANFLGTPSTPGIGDDALNFHIHFGNAGSTGGAVYSVRAPDRENGAEPLVEVLGPTTARITGSWDIADAWRINARIENATDRDYELARGYNTPGRAGFLELVWAPR